MSSSARKLPRKPETAQALSSSLLELPGIGKQRQAVLATLGVRSVHDLLGYPPLRYIDRTAFARMADLRPGLIQTVSGKVIRFELKPGRRKRLTIVHFEDGSGRIRCLWFNQPYLKRVFTPGTPFVLSGLVRPDPKGPVMVHPEYEPVEEEGELVHTGRIVPVYRTRPGLSQKQLRSTVKSALDAYAATIRDLVPEGIRTALGLDDLETAVRKIHFPDQVAEAEAARRRLAFDELLMFQTLFALARKQKPDAACAGQAGEDASRAASAFTARLPFSLTDSQASAARDITGDLAGAQPMRRLLQGDVGCGKTVVAALAIAVACASGGQAALLCPTEILAEQHFETMQRCLGPFGISIRLLTGSLAGSEREAAHRAAATGEAGLVVGTHALIGDRVTFKRLRLVVVDEEQRFGVLQRTKLVRDVPTAHLLVVSATPIPRTLALTAYGDLDVTIIDQMPPGRGGHTTTLVADSGRERALKEIAAMIDSGLKGYYVCPAVEEGSADLVDVAQARAQLERLLAPGKRVAILTGRTSRDERLQILKDFVADRIGLVVATTVVEVGMDIPSATLLVVDQAERFGLSQLHQMRGRVARTDAPSRSFLLASEAASEKAWARLKVLESSFDGFDIAEKDLMLRGPGEPAGTRQHGIPGLKYASLPGDLDLMLKARDEAFRCILGPEMPGEWRRWVEAVGKLADGNPSLV